MQKRLIIGLVLLFISGLTFYRMLRPGFYPMHDDMQAMRLLQMHNCTVDWQIPCRWVPDMGFGYGYPQFNYYAPLPYYVMEVFNLLGLSILASVKLGFILSVLIGVYGMYLLSSGLWGTYAGIISASFFALIPYRSVDMWARGAMGELWGLAIFPFVFLAIRKAVFKRKHSETYLALAIAALLTSHNISALIFLPFILVWTLYLLCSKHGSTSLLLKFKNVKKLLFGFVWGFVISAFFVVPAWFEKGLVHIDSLTGGYFDYRQHFVSLSQLLFSNYWNFGSSQIGRYDEVYLGVGIVQWTIAVLSVFVYLALKRKKTIKTVLLLVILAMFATFMSHPKSQVLWSSFGILKYVQFPWRYLLVASFLFSFSAGSMVSPIKNTKAKAKKLTILLISILIIFNASYFRPVNWLDINDEQKFSGDEWLRQQTISIYDYLPKSAEKAPEAPAMLEPMIINGEGEISNLDKGSDWYKFNIDVISDILVIRLPIYYFPNWTVKVNNINKEISFDNDLGLITFELEKGENVVQAELMDTPVRKIANIMSLFALLFVPYHLTKDKRKKKRI